MSSVLASLIAIGNELTTGQTLDTNSAFIGEALSRLGFVLKQVSVIRDDIDSITDELKRLSHESSLIITTGGLGPTSDDLTRNAIAQFLNKDLELNQSALEKLEDFARRRKRVLNENNKRQAYFPKGAEIIPNALGTADAFLSSTTENETHVIALPGVPREMKQLFSEFVEPWCLETFSDLKKYERSSLRIFGLPESKVGELIEACELPAGVDVAYRPSFPEILLSFSILSSQDETQKLEQAKKAAKAALGEEFIISEEPNTGMAAAVGALLQEHQLTLAAAESCTGGLLGSEIVSVPGASQYFLGSLVTYSNAAKEEILGVQSETLAQYGAVSKETALEMAAGTRDRLKSDIAVSITGVAGPNGASEKKPAGSAWIAISLRDLHEGFFYQLPVDRNRFRLYCASTALDLVRRAVLGFSLEREKQ